MKLFHQRVLLTSQYICSDPTEKLGKRIWMIYYIVLRSTRKKIEFFNENIHHCCFKKTWMQHQKEIKIQRGKSLYSPLLIARQLYDFLAWIHFYEKNLKTSRGKLWRHHCSHIKLATLWLYDYAHTPLEYKITILNTWISPKHRPPREKNITLYRPCTWCKICYCSKSCVKDDRGRRLRG